MLINYDVKNPSIIDKAYSDSRVGKRFAITRPFCDLYKFYWLISGPLTRLFSSRLLIVRVKVMY